MGRLEPKRRDCSVQQVTSMTGHKQMVEDLREHDQVDSHFVVRSKAMATTRTGAPYLNLRLGDRSGEIEGRIWEGAERLDSTFAVNDVVRVRGRVERFRDQLQINVSHLESVPLTSVDPSLFLPRSPEDPERMWRQLRQLAAKVNNQYLRRLLHHLLGQQDLREAMKRAPAAKSMHHAYLGGLLEHTISVTTLLERLCDHYPRLDRDLLITAGICHDIGKIDEFTYGTSLDYTDAGRLVGHVVLGFQRLAAAIEAVPGFPPSLALALEHLLLSHHGEYEFGAPKRPKTPEAFALHYADDLDAKMNHLANLLEREAGGESNWTSFQRVYDRFIYKYSGGPAGEEKESRKAAEKHSSAAGENYSLLDQLED